METATQTITAETIAVAPAIQVDTLQGAAGQMMRLAQRYGWDVQAYANPESNGLRCRRGKERISMLWLTAGGFNFAIAMLPHAKKIGAAEAKRLLTQDATYDDCGEQFTAHR